MKSKRTPPPSNKEAQCSPKEAQCSFEDTESLPAKKQCIPGEAQCSPKEAQCSPKDTEGFPDEKQCIPGEAECLTENKILIYDVGEMREYAAAARQRAFNEDEERLWPLVHRPLVASYHLQGQSIGLVPTMGALHEGHLSLIRRSASENDLTIVSVFVNPIQFNDPGDFDSYPKTLGADAEKAFNSGANVVFAPDARSMYPEGFSTHVDMTGLSERLCGASRPSHFKGVLTVVAKLFGICAPHRAYFGEKDAQQLAAVKKMAAELCMNVEIAGCPTVREDDGLAMSSRNARLPADERIAARCLYRALTDTKSLYDSGEKSPGRLAAALRAGAETEPLARVDYAEIVDPQTFETPASACEGSLLMLAVYIGEVRLIDNMRL